MRQGRRRERGPQGGSNRVMFSASFCPELTKTSRQVLPARHPARSSWSAQTPSGPTARGCALDPQDRDFHPNAPPDGPRAPHSWRHAAPHAQQTRDCLSTRPIAVHPSLEAAHRLCTCVFFSLQSTDCPVQCRTEVGAGGQQKGSASAEAGSVTSRSFLAAWPAGGMRLPSTAPGA